MVRKAALRPNQPVGLRRTRNWNVDTGLALGGCAAKAHNGKECGRMAGP